jgi:hypothetical protein
MTHIVNVNGTGRAYTARRLGERAANGDLRRNTTAALNVLAAIAHAKGAVVIETNGKRIPVQPKWLMPIITAALNRMDKEKQARQISGLIRTAKGSGQLMVTRKMLDYYRLYIASDEQ